MWAQWLFLIGWLSVANSIKIGTVNVTSSARTSGQPWTPPVVFTEWVVGSNAQKLRLSVETDFEDILVVGPTCNSIPCRGVVERNVYDPSKSTTATDTCDAAKVRYHRSAVKGQYYVDSVKVNGLVAEEVGMAVLNTANREFYYVPADGIFGLSYLGNLRGSHNLPSPVDSILGNQTSGSRSITIWTNKARTNKDRYGQLTFGKYNTQKCRSDLHYSKINNDDFRFQVEKIRVGELTSHRMGYARLDFTSPNIGVPTTVYKNIKRTLGASGSSTMVNCNTIKNIKMGIKLGGVYYPLEWEDYAYQDGNYCYLNLEDNGDDFYVEYNLGEPFLRRYCVTVDTEKQLVGFATSS